MRKWATAIRKFTNDRRAIARWVATQLEDSVKTGVPVILELSIPPSLSAEFGEERRRRVRTARHGLLKTSNPFKRFSERRRVGVS